MKKEKLLRLLLTSAASVGVIFTAVASAKAATNASEFLRKNKEEKHDNDPEQYTTKKIVMTTWKY